MEAQEKVAYRTRQALMEAREMVAYHIHQAQKAGLETVASHTLQVLKAVLAMAVYRNNLQVRKVALAMVFGRNLEQTVRGHSHSDPGLALEPSVGKGCHCHSLAVAHPSAFLGHTDLRQALPYQGHRVHLCRSL